MTMTITIISIVFGLVPLVLGIAIAIAFTKQKQGKISIKVIRILSLAHDNVCNRNIRYGQALFNATHKLYPKIANKICGTENDCFYNDDKVDRFLSAFMKEIKNEKHL
jgi:hypothetical protein